MAAVLQGCGSSPGNPTALAQAIGKDPSCASLRDRLWSELYRQVDTGEGLPTASAMGTALTRVTNGVRTREALVGLYGGIEHAVHGLGREDSLRALAEMEIGDRTTPEKSSRQDGVERGLALVRGTAVTESGACQEPTPPTPENPANPDPTSIPLFEAWRTRVPSSLYGAYKTISVGYQSCNVLDQKSLTISVPSVSGIVIIGTHPNGVGKQRTVSDADALFKSNPYYATRVSPGVGCFSAANSPLIYDYGGKPYTNSSSNTIDLTQNAGSGTSALGVDCSGFISTAILSGGLRLKVGSSSKAAQVNGVSASMFADPLNNGLTCFSPVTSTATEDLRSGDVIANTGHVVMVDSAGSDPLGLARAKISADCTKLTASGFNFTIIQSSPSKGGIGMNRYRAADYLAGSSSMRTGLEAYAKAFCASRFGASPTTLKNTSQAVLIRHSGSASCLDQALPLVGESCLRNCAPNPLLADSSIL